MAVTPRHLARKLFVREGKRNVSENAMPKVGDVVAEKYQIDGIVGEGGMGKVFSATHIITQKRVALKWMNAELARDNDATQRFFREAQAAGRINHPNVVDIYDVEKHGDTVFLVMEFLYGEPLTARLLCESLQIADTIRLLLPALRGVAAAHRQGVIHRDIKPDNIFLCRSPEGKPREAKVLDFGISKVSSRNGQLNPRLTRTGTLMGTPYYMSPEQIRGDKDVGPQADVYAFGVILYEALTGQLPFNAETFSALVIEVATGTPIQPKQLREELPVELEAVIVKAMAREPDDRYPDIESLAHALEPFSEGASFESVYPYSTGIHSSKSRGQFETTSTPFSTETAVTETPIRIPKKKSGSFAVMVGGLAFALLIGGVFGAFKLLGGSTDQPVNEVRPADAPPRIDNGNSPEPGIDTISEIRKPELKATPESEQPDKTDSTQSKKDDQEAEDKDEEEPAETKKVSDDSLQKQADKESKRRSVRRPRKASATPKKNKRVSTPPALSPTVPRPEALPTESKPKPVRGRTGGLNVDEF